MYCLIAFTLLLFEIGCTFGHTLPRKEILSNVDVYSVQENNHETLTFVNPKSTKPTVKEIIFYHFIEKPYDQSQVVITHRQETMQGPDFDDSRRPFTNGHGMQINHLDSDEDDDDDDDDKNSDESTESTHSSDEDITDHDDTKSVSDDSETEDDKSDDSDDSNEKSGSDEENKGDEDINANDRISISPVVEDVISSSGKAFDSNEVTESVETSTSQMIVLNASETTTEEVSVITEPIGTPVVDEVESEKMAARNIIFNQLRERYQESWNPTIVSSRKKRDIEYNDSEDVDVVGGKELPEMPEAPILPELNLDELPQEFRDVISTEKAELPEMPEAPVLPELDLDELRKNFTDENISSEKPEHPELRNYNEETGSGDGTEEVNSETMRPYEEGEDVRDSQEDAPTMPRTYGMELINGTGYVWNELNKMPEMPISPELNLDESPQNTRDAISFENPEQPELNNDHVVAESEIEDRTEEIIGKALSPYEEGEGVSDSKEEAPNRPRTYGMELHNGTGYVWNELAEIPQTSSILPEPNLAELPKNARDEESPDLPEMPETPFLPELNLEELPENTRDEISSEKPELPEMPEAPVLPELNSDELPQNTRDEISSEKPELPEMPEAPVLPELNSDDLPDTRDEISSEKPELPEMPEAPVSPELNSDELPQNNRAEISSEKPEFPEMPEAPVLPELNLDELPQNTRDEISSEEPELPVMPEAPTLPEPNLDEVPRTTGGEISSEKPELPKMPEAPILPELILDELPQDIRDVLSTENLERSEIRNNNEDTDRRIEDRTEKINSEVVTPYEGDVGDSTPQNPTTYSMEFDSGSGYVRNGFEEKSVSDGEKRDKVDRESEDINVNNRESPELYNNNNDESKKEIEHRIDEMISELMRPYEEGEDVGPSNEEATKKPRTYGMKLKNGVGYVWNDLWGNPGMSYVVGDPSSLPNEEHEVNVTKKDEAKETQDSDDSRSDLEDINVNKNENLSNEEDKNRRIENENISFDTREENSSYNYISTEQFTTDTTKSYYNDKEQHEEEENVTENGKTMKDSEAYQPKLTESIIEILKNQDNDLWIWLQDWTSTYMELLMKHVKKIVEQEVRKQLNLRTDHFDHEKSHIEADYSESQQDGKVIIKANTHNKDETITIGGVEIPVTHDTNFDISDILNDDKFTEIYEKSQIELLKGRRHKGKDKESTIEISNVKSVSNQIKPEKEGKFDANNIFGNSYNNDKVTNIYIFYPKEDSRKITEDLKLDKDNNKTAFIFEKPECTKIEEKEPAKKELDPIINIINEITTPANPTEETLQPTESFNEDEFEKSVKSEENIAENERDNEEMLQASTSESLIANVDIEMTTVNVQNEQNKVSESGDGVSEKIDTSEISVEDTNIKINKDTPTEGIAKNLKQDKNVNENKGIAAERKNGDS